MTQSLCSPRKKRCSDWIWTSDCHIPGLDPVENLENNQLDTHFFLILQCVSFNPIHVSSIICSSSGGWILLMQHQVSSSQSVTFRCKVWVFSQTVHRTVTEWEDDTRCCINKIQPADDEHIILETCRVLKETHCKIKKVCIKLVIVKVILRCAVNKT